MSSRQHLGKPSLGVTIRGALVACVVTALVGVATPVSAAASGAGAAVTCTFDGKAGPAAITGVLPGTTTVSIRCTGTAGLGLAAVMASPLGGIVIAPGTATNEADTATLTAFKQAPAGTYTATLKVPATFHATDPKAVCPPAAGQFNAGLVGCPVAVINTSNLEPFAGQEAILETSAQTTPPDQPTVATTGNVVTAGEHITIADATGACPDDPTATSQCWWGDALASSSTAGAKPTLTVTLDGKKVPGASATVSGPGAGGLATYDGTTLVPQSLSGSLTLPSHLSNGVHALTVTQTNITPFDGNGRSRKPGSPISASTTLVVGPISGPLVSGLTPASGTSAGGTSVTISGTNFTGATAVHFGATAAKFTLNSATSISATAPKGTGAVDVTVTTPRGTSYTSDADRYVYTAPAAPVVTAISPSSGTQDGGTVVELSGSGFLHATAVRFGSATAKSFEVLSDNEVRVISPSGSGVVNVTVTTSLGRSKDVAVDTYAYQPGPASRPEVTRVSPRVGRRGTVVTVTGSGFSGARAVEFGTHAASRVTVESDATIEATVPAGSVTGSAVDITVRTPRGTSAVRHADRFTYVNGPVVSGINPTSGSPLGGYTVTVNGSGFTGARAVDFGSTPATSFTVEGDSTITATVPAGHGRVDVSVVTPAGRSAASAADRFGYGAPTVTSVAPAAGSPLGGYTTTISGTGFSGATAVDFGLAAATDVSILSDDSLTATVPAGTGTVDVTVTTPAGMSAPSAAGHFSYVSTPTVTSVSPGEGPAAGGNFVTISGTSLTGATTVTFGTTPASDLVVVSDTSLTVTAPAGTGTVDVTVTVPGGTSPIVGADEYTYVPAPTVTGVSPSSGPGFGGTTVDINGTGFTGATSVDFGPGNAASFTVNSDTSITATSPASPAGAGPVDVTVANAGGTSETVPADVFTYVAFPSVTSVLPSAGPLSGGTTVLISGSGFTPTSTVEFGSTPSTDVVVLLSGLIEATSPPGEAGTVDVTVSAGPDTSQTTSADQFTYEGAPTVTQVSPASGPVTGNVTVSITGTNLLGATAVDFGSEPAASLSVTSATSISAVAPASVTPGSVDVTVVTSSGTSATSPSDEFAYVAAPTVTSLSPPSGPVSGGTSVVITGTGFANVSGVTFGGVAATSVVVDSATSITATAPGQTTPAPFGATVQVTTPGGTGGDGTADDTFVYTPVTPTITAVSPDENTTAGDSLVTITGTGFTTDAAVTFGADGGALEGNISVNSPTSLTANSPAGLPGTVDLTVTTSGGTSAETPADEYTYVTETPTLTVSPQTGITGGETLTVTGSGFPTGNWNVNSSGVVLAEADPLAGLLTGFSAIDDLDVNALAEPTVDNAGDFTTTFTLDSPFTPFGDPNGACAPLQNEVDVGLVGCAVVALSLNAATLLADLGDVPIIYAGTHPDPPTLAVRSSVVRAGATVSFSGSGWWGSYPGSGATAEVCGIDGKPSRCNPTTGSGVVSPVTYSGVGGSLHGATLSGSITIGSDLAGCTTCFLRVTQPNLTPLRGKVTASVALTILPRRHRASRVDSLASRWNAAARGRGAWAAQPARAARRWDSVRAAQRAAELGRYGG